MSHKEVQLTIGRTLEELLSGQTLLTVELARRATSETTGMIDREDDTKIFLMVEIIITINTVTEIRGDVTTVGVATPVVEGRANAANTLTGEVVLRGGTGKSTVTLAEVDLRHRSETGSTERQLSVHPVTDLLVVPVVPQAKGDATRCRDQTPV